MTTSTFDGLCAILVKHNKVPLERLTPDVALDSLGIDSLGTVELLWNVEDAFRIKLPPEPADLSTLGDVVRYIDALVAGQGMPATPAAPVSSSLHAS